MAILDSSIAIEGFKGLFIKNSIDANIKILSKKDYSKFNNEGKLHFVMRAKVYKKEYRLVLSSRPVLGKTVLTVIRDAYRERDEKIDEIKSGNYVKDVNMNFTQLWEEYGQWLVSTTPSKQTYIDNNTYFYNKHLKPTIGDMNIKNITTPMLQKIVHTMIKKPYRIDKDGNEKFYAEATVAQIKKCFGPVFHYATHSRRRYLTESPMEGVEIPSFDNARDFKLSDKKAAKLYNTLMNYPELKFRGIFMFLLEGRRQGEVLSLTWDRVDLEQGLYYLPQTEHKGKGNLTFILPAHLIEVLRDFPDARKGYVFKSDRASKANGGKPGGKITNIRKRWSSIMKSLEIEDVTRHDMRHWLGNTLVNAHRTTAEVAHVLGHADERISKRYAKTKETTARSAVDTFHNILSRKNK